MKSVGKFEFVPDGTEPGKDRPPAQLQCRVSLSAPCQSQSHSQSQLSPPAPTQSPHAIALRQDATLPADSTAPVCAHVDTTWPPPPRGDYAHPVADGHRSQALRGPTSGLVWHAATRNPPWGTSLALCAKDGWQAEWLAEPELAPRPMAELPSSSRTAAARGGPSATSSRLPTDVRTPSAASSTLHPPSLPSETEMDCNRREGSWLEKDER
ncbi:hypothetical protein BC628DRAFT_90395 [Trametes gibbosa]|nr:hypothetical protein BC628DRAFT_90395 [Trametes gibbosa]